MVNMSDDAEISNMGTIHQGSNQIRRPPR
jgi:hypothetical protein